MIEKGEISDGGSSGYRISCELNSEPKELNISYLRRII